MVNSGRVTDHPDHCRSGSLESPQQSVEQGCGFVEAFEHVDLAVLADKRDGEWVAVRMKADAPGKEWDRLINLPAAGPRSPESGPQPRTGDTTGAAISPRYKSP